MQVTDLDVDLNSGHPVAILGGRQRVAQHVPSTNHLVQDLDWRLCKRIFTTNSSQAQVFNTNLRRHHFSDPCIVPPPLHRLGQRGPILPSRSIVANLGFGLSILFRANQAQLLTTRALKHVKEYAYLCTLCQVLVNKWMIPFPFTLQFKFESFHTTV